MAVVPVSGIKKMQDKNRLQVDIEAGRMDALLKQTGATSRAELLRDALRAYEFLADIPPDQKIEVRDREGNLIFYGSAKLLQ